MNKELLKKPENRIIETARASKKKGINYNARSVQEFVANLPEGMDEKECKRQVDIYLMKLCLNTSLKKNVIEIR